MAEISKSGDCVICKPAAPPWNRERRFEICGELRHDRNARFDRCLDVSSKQKFLLKRVRLVDEDVSNWQSDLFTWSQLRHEHILRYHDAWVARDMQHVLCETARFCLPVLLERMAPDKPCQSLFPVWLFHIASALEYMHERNNENRPILHRNLRPSSILVTDHCTLKLCDFAFSKRLEKQAGTTSTVIGQDVFQSPEIRKGQEYDKSTDIWSYGVTAGHIANYTVAKKAATEEKIKRIITDSGQKPEIQDVITEALQRDHEKRPKASEIVASLREAFGAEWAESSHTPPEDIFPAPLRRQGAPTSSTEGTESHPERVLRDDTAPKTPGQKVSDITSHNPAALPSAQNPQPSTSTQHSSSSHGRERHVSSGEDDDRDKPLPAKNTHETKKARPSVTSLEVGTQTSEYRPTDFAALENDPSKHDTATQTSFKGKRRIRVVVVKHRRRENRQANLERPASNRENTRVPDSEPSACTDTDRETKPERTSSHRRNGDPHAPSHRNGRSETISRTRTDVSPPQTSTSSVSLSHNETPRSHTETHRTYNETPRSYTETPRSHHETHRSHNDTPRSHTETPRSHNETHRSYTETSRSQSETPRSHHATPRSGDSSLSDWDPELRETHKHQSRLIRELGDELFQELVMTSKDGREKLLIQHGVTNPKEILRVTEWVEMLDSDIERTTRNRATGGYRSHARPRPDNALNGEVLGILGGRVNAHRHRGRERDRGNGTARQRPNAQRDATDGDTSGLGDSFHSHLE